MGEVKDKDCIVVDDMIDTGGTIMKAMNELKNMGTKNIYVFVTHGLFNGDFYENFEKCKSINKLYTTNSLPAKNQELEKKLGIERMNLKSLLDEIMHKNFDI